MLQLNPEKKITLGTEKGNVTNAANYGLRQQSHLAPLPHNAATPCVTSGTFSLNTLLRLVISTHTTLVSSALILFELCERQLNQMKILNADLQGGYVCQNLFTFAIYKLPMEPKGHSYSRIYCLTYEDWKTTPEKPSEPSRRTGLRLFSCSTEAVPERRWMTALPSWIFPLRRCT